MKCQKVTMKSQVTHKWKGYLHPSSVIYDAVFDASFIAIAVSGYA